MTDKEKSFPLSLSRIVKKGQRMGGLFHETSTPQTATQNAARHIKKNDTVEVIEFKQKIKKEGLPVPRSENSAAHAERAAMVARLRQQGITDQVVLNAMGLVPRHVFVESGLASHAYRDASLPIGYHQTISQPYIVGKMIALMRAQKTLHRVLEIGTGCGYQAAVLSQVAQEVYSIERIKSLHELAKNNLRPMRIPNIRLHYGDGMLGLPQAAPFDGIILAAAGLNIPQTLLDQMTIGGILIAPVGSRHQMLRLVERTSQFDWNNTDLEEVHFVPLHPGLM